MKRIINAMKDFKWSYVLIEVLIITLGILIALRIDRYKENIDRRERELKILTELKSSLHDDLAFLYRMRTRYNDVIESATRLQQHLFLKREYNDSIQPYAIKTGYGFTFKYRNGVYENLKFHGIDIISNDSLKHKILTLYDFEYPRQTLIISSTSDDRLTPYIQSKGTYELTMNENGEISSRDILKKETFQEGDYLDYVTDRLEDTKEIKRRFELLTNFVEELVKDIEKEIEYRK
jgi:hypothetical protein